MATPRTPNQKKRYKALSKRLARYVALVQNTYDSLALDAANIVITATDYSPSTGKPFRFKDYPQTKARVDELMRFFSLDLNAIVYTGTSEEWKQSNLVQDLLANDVLRAYRVRHGDEKYKKYYQTNNDALKAFRARKDKGKTYSQKIWNQSFNFRREMEYAISTAIEKGQSAITLSKKISKYLHDFPSLCDDYKEKYGEAVDCKDCEYRSIRLARSEINMAYRTAEQTRWEQMDFIKGYEIKLSHAHPKHDVCDELAGIYPKWFKWTGWHPNDLCYVVPIVMSDDEWYSGKGNIIEDFPDNFYEWIIENSERISKAELRGTLPYWIKDNYSSIAIIKNQAPSIKFDISSNTGDISKKDIHDQFNTMSPEFREKIDKYNAIVRAKRKYNSYGDEWEKVYFNEENGGFNVSHIQHQYSSTKAEGANMSGGQAEKFVGKTLAEVSAKQIEFLPENGNGTGKPDVYFDGHTWDIKYISKANENTIRKYIEDARKAERAIFYWDDDNKLDLLKSAVARTVGKFKKKGELNILPSIFYMNRDGLLSCIFDNT